MHVSQQQDNTRQVAANPAGQGQWRNHRKLVRAGNGDYAQIMTSWHQPLKPDQVLQHAAERKHSKGHSTAQFANTRFT
jgi:hypothetical protein